MTKPYYDHDPIWEKRVQNNNPIWGSYSHTVYGQILKIIEDLKPVDRSLLDAGCGAGAFGPRAKAAGLKYCGVDASLVAIKFGLNKFPDLDLKCLDLAKPLKEHDIVKTFGLITCINVLHCLVKIEDRQILLQNLKKLSKPDGFLILSTMLGPVEEKLIDQRIPRAYLPKLEILSELKENGWNKIKYECEEPPSPTSLIGNFTVATR